MSNELKVEGATKIRTKTNLLRGKVDQGFLDIVGCLHRAEYTPEKYLEECTRYFRQLLESGDLDPFIEQAMAQDEQLELLRRHLDDRRYTVLLYKVKEGEVHPPHHHFNVISTQIVVRGTIRLREFDRIGRDENGKLLLKLVNDTELNEGEGFQASEWSRNVHWFQATGGPALIFNTNARGFEKETFDSEDGNFGRRYVDPSEIGEDGIAVCDEFGEDEAVARFGGQSLDAFPVQTT